MRSRRFKLRERRDGLVTECLRRIRESDDQIHAWVEVNPRAPLAEGRLSGVPFGVKDIFETRGMATAYGSPLYAGRQGSSDAALVTELRQAGAVLLGKTHTTAFAYFDPAPTRNPRNLAHTPGGSSSGSAAAVAAGMVPLALGSQTQGSILRPASFCGVVGFKPTYGLLPVDGVLAFAPSLDTVGFFTETADDMAYVWNRQAEPARRLASTFKSPVPDVPVVDLPDGFDKLLPAVKLINHYEGARTHERRWRDHGERIGRKLAQLVVEGLQIPEPEYEAALATLVSMRRKMSDFYREFPVLLTHASAGPAPYGLESTGDPCMNAPFTGLHNPAVSIPLPVEGMPLGLQLTADIGNDDMLLATAVEVERQPAQ